MTRRAVKSFAAANVRGSHHWRCSRFVSKPGETARLAVAPVPAMRNTARSKLRARRMDDDADDFDRYRKLLGEAVDEPRRLALIDLLIKERARDRLKYHLATLEAMRAPTVANVLGTSTT